MFLLDSRRLQLATASLVGSVPAALAVWLASRSEPLTRQRSTLAAAADDGRSLLAAIGILMLVAAAAALSVALFEQRARIPQPVRIGYAVALVAACAAAIIAVFARFGGPVTLAHKAYRSFTAPPISTSGNLNRRLLSLSSNGRTAEWRVAWHDFKNHPVAGSGAGSYEVSWLRDRRTSLKVRDAHSLYAESLAELGVVGFGLLVAALAVPLIGVARARGHPLVPAAFGAYLTYLLATGVDWDWELPAVTLAGLFCGVAILAAGRGNDAARPLSPRVRQALLVGTAALGVAAILGLAGNLAIARSSDAAEANDYARSAREARTAERWAPWSSEPLRLLGEAQTTLGQSAAARASLRKAISKDPNNWLLWYDLAGASDGAARRVALGHAKRLNPLSPEIAEFERDFGLRVK